MFKHILLATDGSELSDKAAKMAIDLGKALGAKLTAVHVVGNYHLALENEGFMMSELPSRKKRFDEEEAARAKKIFAALKESARQSGMECGSVAAAGDAPYEMLIEQATKLKCDLIVMASHGRRGIEGVLLGSETQKVLTHTKIPVLVCR